MAGKALGVMELKSVGVLMQATDIMAKVADIEVADYERIGSAQVAIFIRGEIQACEAAIKAATEFVTKSAKDRFVTSFVIPDPHEKLGLVFRINPDKR